MIIQASNINHDYNGDIALKNINLQIKKGEFISLIGESGSGKTTLLSILSTLLKPKSGELNFEYNNYLDITNIDKFRQKNIGFIFQFHYLINYLNNFENIKLANEAASNHEIEYLLDLLKIPGTGYLIIRLSIVHSWSLFYQILKHTQVKFSPHFKHTGNFLDYDYNTTSLLTLNKTSDYFIGTLYLAPQKNIMNASYYGVSYDSTLKLDKINLCKKATNGCSVSCVYHQGILKNSDFNKNKIKQARLKRTFKFLLQREEFFIKLIKEINALQKKAQREGLIAAVQLNGTSDILWEKEAFTFKEVKYKNIMEYFKEVQFFDYTKYDIAKNRKNLPSNYHLTYSRAGLHKGVLVDNWEYLKKQLDSQIDVAVIFSKAMKEKMLNSATHEGYKLIDADCCTCRAGDLVHRENNKGLILIHEVAKKTDINSSGFIIQNEDEVELYLS